MKKKIVFIVNPVSGGKNKRRILELVERHIDRARFEPEFALTRHPGHAAQIARTCEADVAVAVGGDGTVSEVAQGLIGSRKALGILPCGSGDGLALHLGLSRRPVQAIRTLNQLCTATMDYGTVCGHPFFCTTGIGLDAIVAADFAKAPRRGLWTYISAAWRTWQHFCPETYTLEMDGTSWSGPAVLVTVGNASQWGNGARITPKASVSDGLLDVTVVEPFRTREIPVLAFRLLTGGADRCRRAKLFRGAHITIRRERPGPAHYDGDPCEAGTELDIAAVPGTLRVVIPPGRKGAI